MEAAWTCLGASWSRLGGLLGRRWRHFFSVWKPYRRHDRFWNDVKPSRTSFLNEFCNEKQCGPSNNHDANVSEGQTCRKSKHIVKTHGFGCFLCFKSSCYVKETSNETAKLRSRSKTCIYVQVEVDLKASWRSLGGPLEGVWRRRGASGRALGASHRRLEKQTRPNRLNRPRKSAATRRKSAPLRSEQRIKVYLSG